MPPPLDPRLLCHRLTVPIHLHTDAYAQEMTRLYLIEAYNCQSSSLAEFSPWADPPLDNPPASIYHYRPARRCTVKDDCYHMMTSDAKHGYALTHQVLFVVEAQHVSRLPEIQNYHWEADPVPLSHWEADPVPLSHWEVDPVPLSHWEVDPVPLSHWEADPVPLSHWQADPVPLSHWQADPVPLSHWETDPVPLSHWEADPVPLSHW